LKKGERKRERKFTYTQIILINNIENVNLKFFYDFRKILETRDSPIIFIPKNLEDKTE